MAQTTDMAAEKARKQKIILVVAAVLLAALAAIQLPKLLGGSSSTPAAEATDTTATSGTGLIADATATANAVAASTGAVVVVGKPAGYVAGVALPKSSRAPVTSGQLASFTLFEAKDPFVQQVTDDAAASSSPSEEGSAASGAQGSGSTNGGKPGVATTPEPSAAPGVAPSTGDTCGGAAPSTGTPGAGGAPAAPSVPYTYATMLVNGNPEQVELDKPFPTDEKVFVLVAVKKNAVQIGVAGGSLESGKPATLKLGKKLTLVNSATGERWVLKLVYTGSEPETLETFSTATDAAAGAPAAQ
jgi:hypothetical protein